MSTINQKKKRANIFKLWSEMRLLSEKRLRIKFSSSIVREEKTKEITIVTVVWIADHNYHNILRTFALNFSKNYEWFEKPYQNSKEYFIRYPNTSKSV